MREFIYEQVQEQLESIVGRENIFTSEIDKGAYSVDVWCVSRHWMDHGLMSKLPQSIVFPRSSREVSDIIDLANKFKIPITPRGGGGGGLGGGLPLFGGIVIDTKRLDKIVRLNENSLTVTAQTGIMQIDLEQYLNYKGYTLNHLPASIYCSTLGGFLSTRGSGVMSSKYGKIEDMVLSLEVVLPTGEIIRTLPVPEHSSGPRIEHLFMGAEGTLGIITEATLKISYLPEVRRIRGLLFDDLHSALEASRDIMINRLQPCVLRVYDYEDTRTVVKRELGIDVDNGAYVIVGFDGFKEIVKAQEGKALKIFRIYGMRDLGEESGKHWWDHRYDPYYPPHTLESKRYLYGIVDSITSHDQIENLYFSMKKELEDKFKKWNIIFGAHFSHWYEWGASVYPRFIVKDPPDDPHEFAKLNNEIWRTAIKIVLANGGVLSEHHGIGLQLAPFMKEQYKEAFKVLENIKHVLDPNNIMNPDKLGFAI
ncbi:MAG: FAD-binding oxidoreductase [Actinobacteria bacterium]|nr:FAD-binding oxidoreductase [Actinomycetota bacterium]